MRRSTPPPQARLALRKRAIRAQYRAEQVRDDAQRQKLHSAIIEDVWRERREEIRNRTALK